MQEIGANSKHLETIHGPDNMVPGDRKRRRISRSPDSSLIQFAYRGTTMKDLTNSPLESNDGIGDISRMEYGKHTDEHVDGRRTKNFEKRARHKMKDIDTKGQKSKPPKKDKATNKAIKKRRKNGEVAPRNKSDVLIEGYSAENIANQRITLQPSHRMGIFRNGRASSPTQRKGLPDLSFSEVDFLRKRDPPHLAVEEVSGNKNARKSDEGIQDKTRSDIRFSHPGTIDKAQDYTVVSSDGDEIPENATTAISESVGGHMSSGRTLSFRSRRSITLDLDGHSEYSRFGTQSRFAPGHRCHSSNNSPARTNALTSATNVPNFQRDESAGCQSNLDMKIEEKPVSCTKIFLRKEPTKISQPSSSPLAALLRICEDIPASRVTEENTPITTHQTKEYSRMFDTSPKPCPKYIANEKWDYQPAHHISAEFVGSASNLHEEAYQTPLLGNLGIDSINRSFYSRDDVYEPDDSHLQHVEANEIYHPQNMIGYRSQDFMQDHSRDALDLEIDDFNHESSNICNQNATPEIYAWENADAEHNSFEHDYLYNETEGERWQDSQGGGFNVSTYADNSAVATTTRSCMQPGFLLAEDGIDSDLKNFWRSRHC
ncbi:hypothetical protein K440DRAFT_617106 [Wilcoxina mikolae CBS 423.85]|nr:hypothetical protein K440DRAFT_617106 [Wilcoxina mikolae CBS 423.85]